MHKHSTLPAETHMKGMKSLLAVARFIVMTRDSRDTSFCARFFHTDGDALVGPILGSKITHR